MSIPKYLFPTPHSPTAHSFLACKPLPQLIPFDFFQAREAGISIICKMGILVSCARPPHAMEMKGVIRILHSGGLETEYMAPLSAKEVLLDHPQHLIFDARDLQSGDRRPVSGKEELLSGHVYLVVPLSALQSHHIVSLASNFVAYEEDSMHSSMENDDAPQETNSNSRDYKRRLQQFIDGTQMGICDTPELKTAYVNHLLNKNRSMAWRPGLVVIDEGCFAC